MSELWDVYDSSGKPTGKTVFRGKSTLKAGEYHLVVHIWIISERGNFLIQRRSDSKKLMPGEWAATGGAVISGEDSFTAARRELFEELGIKAENDNLKKVLRLKRRNSFIDVYVTVSNKAAKELVLQKSEVSSAKWVDKKTLCEMIENRKFHNYGKDYFDKVFEKTDEFRRILV